MQDVAKLSAKEGEESSVAADSSQTEVLNNEERKFFENLTEINLRSAETNSKEEPPK